jgi:hypothetical protein
MSSIATIAEWTEAATTIVAVRPEYRENLQEEFEDWLGRAASVQVSSKLLGDVLSHLAALQDALRTVMRVELAIDADFAAPAIAMELGDEVKAAKAWLQGLTDPLVPPPSTGGSNPAVETLSPDDVGGSTAKDEKVVEEIVQRREDIVSVRDCFAGSRTGC